jgi:hypothetical protein
MNGLYKDKRRTYIKGFTESLTTYMRKSGYTMKANWKPEVVGRWLYRIAVAVYAKNNSFDKIEYDTTEDSTARQEDYDQYMYTMEMNRCIDSCGLWLQIEDLDPDSRMGTYVWLEVENLLWRYLDLYCSRQTTIVEKGLYDSDSESDYMNHDGKEHTTDKYIQEVSEGYHGGKGWKV